MSTFPTSEALQTHVRWRHLAKHHDIIPFLSLQQANYGLQEGQLYTPPLRDKASNVVNLSLVPSLLKGKQHLVSDFVQCGHTSIPYETRKNQCMVAEGDNVTHIDIGSEKGTSTLQTNLFSSDAQWTGLGQNAFEGSLHTPELENKYSDYLTKPMKYGQEQQISDYLLMGNYASVQPSAEANADLKKQGTKAVDNIHGYIVQKRVSAAIDKKEMRARRNRESARRSRMKSKQHFQTMEQTFVLMSRENRALLALMEKLLPNYIVRFPHLRGKLLSLFEMGL